MIVTISGQSGSGKTTVANLVAERLGIPAVDVGGIFRGLAAKRGLDILEMARYAEKHPEIDRELDAATIKMCREKKDLVLQGRLAAWMTRKNGLEAFRVWIDASPRVRAERIVKREGGDLAKVLAYTNERDAENRRRYLDTYGLDLNDLSVYDTVIRTDNRSIEQVVSALIRALHKVWPKRPRKPHNPKKKRLSRPSPRPAPRRARK